MKICAARCVALIGITMIIGSTVPGKAADGVNQSVFPKARNHPLQSLWSGKRFASETARALHDAEDQNPANGVLADGALLWRRVEGEPVSYTHLTLPTKA